MSVNELSMVNADGTRLGQSATETISFYGATPIAQRSNASQAAVATTAAISSSSVGGGTVWGFSTSTQANAVVSLQNELRAALVALGAIKGS